MVDYGFAPLDSPQDRRLRRLFQLRSGTALVSAARNRRTVHELIPYLENTPAPAVVRPIDNVLLGSHATRFNLFLPLYPGQGPAVNKPANSHTDYEIVKDVVDNPAPDKSVEFPGVIFNQDLENAIHFKGCNIGKSTAFLRKLKEAFGNSLPLTAPLHFHGIDDNQPRVGLFEFMAYEFSVRMKTAPATRADLVAEFIRQNAAQVPPFKLIDGSKVPDERWNEWIPRTRRNRVPPNTATRTLFALGATIGRMTTLRVTHDFRVDTRPFGPWIAVFEASNFPAPANYQREFEANAADADEFKGDYPMYVRSGYPSFRAFIEGHRWDFVKQGLELHATGQRVEYTVMRPITEPSTGNLVFNFFPAAGSGLDPIVRLVENDPVFFGTV